MVSRILALLFCCALHAEEPFVMGTIVAELGNNLFQVAAACAVAWDHGATPCFPEMVNRLDTPLNPQHVPLNYSYVFFRCNTSSPQAPISFQWNEPSFAYHPIPYHPNMRVCGYFQSEKYFAHHRERLLALFAPRPELLSYLRKKYSHLLNHPYTVGVQIRHQYEDPSARLYIQYGKDYLRKAAAHFPQDALYVVSSNNMAFARSVIPEEMERVVFIDDEPHYVNLYLMSLCKHNIVTNSTFGWWSAWLNQNPGKRVIAPAMWYHPLSPLLTYDIVPESWIKLDAKWGPLNNPSTYN
jgi:hypothetical protein